MATRLRRFAVESLAVAAATAAGIAVYFFTLMGPALVFGNDIMLAWGWIGGILGFWTGYQAGGYARAVVRRLLLKPIR